MSTSTRGRGVLAGVDLTPQLRVAKTPAPDGKPKDLQPETPRPVLGEQYVEVPPALIVGHSRAQTRAGFDPELNDEDRALVESIRSEGQRIPVILRESPNRLGRYILQLGRRRLGAVLSLGLPYIKAIIRREGQQDADIGTLLENIRKELTPLEKARAIQILHDDYALTYEEVARRVGLSPRYALMLMKLMGAESGVLELVEEERLPARAAIEVARVPSEHQLALAERVIDLRLPLGSLQQVAAVMTEEGLEPEAALTRIGVIAAAGPVETEAVRAEPDRRAAELSDTPTGLRHRAAVTGLSRAAIAILLTRLRPDLAPLQVDELARALEGRFASAGWVKCVALLADEATGATVVDRAREIQRQRWAPCGVKALEALAALNETTKDGADPIPDLALRSLKMALERIEAASGGGQ